MTYRKLLQKLSKGLDEEELNQEVAVFDSDGKALYAVERFASQKEAEQDKKPRIGFVLKRCEKKNI